MGLEDKVMKLANVEELERELNLPKSRDTPLSTLYRNHLIEQYGPKPVAQYWYRYQCQTINGD